MFIWCNFFRILLLFFLTFRFFVVGSNIVSHSKWDFFRFNRRARFYLLRYFFSLLIRIFTLLHTIFLCYIIIITFLVAPLIFFWLILFLIFIFRLNALFLFCITTIFFFLVVRTTRIMLFLSIIIWSTVRTTFTSFTTFS